MATSLWYSWTPFRRRKGGPKMAAHSVLFSSRVDSFVTASKRWTISASVSRFTSGRQFKTRCKKWICSSLLSNTSSSVQICNVSVTRDQIHIQSDCESRERQCWNGWRETDRTCCTEKYIVKFKCKKWRWKFEEKSTQHGDYSRYFKWFEHDGSRRLTQTWITQTQHCFSHSKK